MKVFISWSGQLSKELGEEFRKWLPAVLQSIKPYFTPDDVEKGTRWYSEISKELEASQIGILILTRENIQSSWIMFETGALSKQMSKSQICPILFGIENADLQGPLVQFQSTLFNQEDMLKLIKTINSACGEQRLEESVLVDIFDTWWPKLEKEVFSKLEKHKESSGKKLRDDRQLIEEILSLVRMLASSPKIDINPAAIRDLVEWHSQLVVACRDHDYDKLALIVEDLKTHIDYIYSRTIELPPLTRPAPAPAPAPTPLIPEIREIVKGCAKY